MRILSISRPLLANTKEQEPAGSEDHMFGQGLGNDDSGWLLLRWN